MRGKRDGEAFENRGAPFAAAASVGDYVRHGGILLRQEVGYEAPFERRCGGGCRSWSARASIRG